MTGGSAFRVDLRGLVDLLSHNLYSSPRVVVRELLQNAVDALTAADRVRERVATGAPDVLLVPSDVSPDGRLHVVDTGVGLTAAEAEEFLATIGASSKRDELGLARTDFLGQFGIGLLSAFLVADEVEVLSRSVHGGSAVRWTASADGTYDTVALPDDGTGTFPGEAGLWREVTAAAGADVGPWPPHGTWVRVRPRREARTWTCAAMVHELAVQSGRLLERDVRVVTAAGTAQPVCDPDRPWDAATSVERTSRLEQLTGVRLLDSVEVRVPSAGLVGALGLLAEPTGPLGRPPLRVYARGMLVGEQVPGLLPDWAFVVRGVVDTAHLRLTASREQLHDDDGLEAAREEITTQVRAWLLRMSRTRPERFERFVRTHHTALLAAAAHDDELLTALLPWLPVSTASGPRTLAGLVADHGSVLHTLSDADFALVQPVAAAQGLPVVNGGIAHVLELLARLPDVMPGASVQQLHPHDLADHLQDVDEVTGERLAPLLAATQAALTDHGVQVVARAFEPVSVPALVLDDPDGRRARRDQQARDESDELWAGLLDLLGAEADGPAQRLVLNARSPLVDRLAEVTDPALRDAAVQQLYCQALVAGRRPVGTAQRALMQRSFAALLEQGLGSAAGRVVDQRGPA